MVGSNRVSGAVAPATKMAIAKRTFDVVIVGAGGSGMRAALALHAWVGKRDILMDYVRPLGQRHAAYFIVNVTLAACVTTMAAVLWGLQ